MTGGGRTTSLLSQDFSSGIRRPQGLSERFSVSAAMTS
jgi:hypothetical protein